MHNRLILTIALLSYIYSYCHSQQPLTDSDADDRYPRWSPDGNHIAFESNRDGNWNIYVMNSNGNDLQQITTDPADDRFPTWHPDGDRILYASKRSGKFQLYVAPLAGGAAKRMPLDGVPDDILFPDYSPDGRSVAFSSQSNLFVAPVSDGLADQITFDSTRALYPRWSANGSTLAFFSRRDTGGKTDELYTHDLQSQTTLRITHWPTHNFAPSWSDDGRHLICATSMEGGRPELFVVTLKTGEMTQVTHNSFGDTEPDWEPGGNSVLYACQAKGNYDICWRSLDDLVHHDKD